jgi:L,D-transpeptidase-like protein
MSKISYIIINIDQQRLYCMDQSEKIIIDYPVSTSSAGSGNQEGSFKTPLGKHSIAQKIGADCAINEVFVGRKPLGVLEKLRAANEKLPDDIITSRILWLQGLESGYNKGEGIDSFQRYIYIHGTSEENKIGQPASHGCVRMLNNDVIELFELVNEGCIVLIQEKENE